MTEWWSTMAVLVTGARGAIGRALIGRLVAAGVETRAASSDPGALPETGSVTASVPVVRLDLTRPAADAADAFAGVAAVFLYAEPDGIDALVAAMVAAGVGKVVVLSTDAVGLCAESENEIARRHAVVERAVTASPLTTVVLRPGPFAARALEWAEPARTGGTIERTLPDVPLYSIHPADIADVAFTALTTDELDGRVLNLRGPEPLTARDQARVLGEAVGRQLEIVEVDLERERELMDRFLPPEIAAAVVDYWLAYSRGIPADSVTSDEVTGIASRTFGGWIEENAARFGRAAAPPNGA